MLQGARSGPLFVNGDSARKVGTPGRAASLLTQGSVKVGRLKIRASPTTGVSRWLHGPFTSHGHVNPQQARCGAPVAGSRAGFVESSCPRADAGGWLNKATLAGRFPTSTHKIENLQSCELSSAASLISRFQAVLRNLRDRVSANLAEEALDAGPALHTPVDASEGRVSRNQHAV